MGNLGICFVNPAPQIEPGYVTAMARKCDQAGLHSFWTIDRIAYDNLEALTVLAAVAGATDNIRLGTSVLLSALRHPALLAKTVATLDFLSNGRMTLGIGFGSRESDFTSVEIPWEHRGTRAEESLGLMKRLWTEDEVEHHGRFFDLHSTRFGPDTIQSPHPPIWMGGTAETVLKRVGRLADGYICGSNAVHDFDTVWDKISGHARAAGRDPDSIEKAGLTFIAIDDDKSKAVAACSNYLIRYYGKVRMDVEKYMLVGSADACADGINRIFAGGLQTLIIGLAIADLAQLDTFVEKVLPQVRG
ncbi:MAG: LLM class flavin-dependent oxidoreductase [Deltaproteobacteria bacterium]|nr:LLM class flavin-dependent oxidoreductase [Deltaproteobacteria bacterium]